MKSKILNMLKKNEGKFLSGEEISHKLNVSRQAISKHIKKLKEQGYDIESISRKGHRLIFNDIELFSKEEIQSESRTVSLGKKLIFLEKVSSTNDYAKTIAFDDSNETVIIADEQISGRGRLGRDWYSEKGTGIWMSIILKPDIEPAEAPKITQVAAAAMTLAINEITGAEVKIKWPNDIIINKKKVCGILTEMNAELGTINYVVVGIGVNVNQSSFSDELKNKATSIKQELDKNISRKDIVISFLYHFEKLYNDFINSGSLIKTIKICKEKSILIGNEVRVITKSKVRQVKVMDINSEGQLVIENENGELENIFYGEVSVRGLYGYLN